MCVGGWGWGGEVGVHYQGIKTKHKQKGRETERQSETNTNMHTKTQQTIWSMIAGQWVWKMENGKCGMHAACGKAERAERGQRGESRELYRMQIAAIERRRYTNKAKQEGKGSKTGRQGVEGRMRGERAVERERERDSAGSERAVELSRSTV